MQRIVGFLTAVCLLLSVVAHCQEVRGSVDVAEGEDAVLRCRFDPALVDPAEASFYWSHRSTVWDNVAIEEKPFRKRYRIDFSPAEGRYDLHINQAAYDGDNGQFACRARRSGSGRVLHAETFQLTVLLRPEPPQLHRPPRLSEGAPAELSCSSVGGSPPPELRWYRRGQSTPLSADLSLAEHRAEPTESRLTLPLTREDDGAELECVVWNRAMAAGERLAASVLLSVDYYPRVTVGPSNPLRVEAGRAVQMRCQVDAKPSVANVRWIRNGAFINTNFAHQIDVVEPSDAGVYTCSAENAVGERAAELRLDVLYAPRVTAESERQLELGGSAQVRCEVDANPPAERVYWLREGDAQFRQDGPMLRLTRVTAQDGGRFTCVAVNRVHSVGVAEAEERVGNATTSVLVRHRPGAASITPESPVGVEGRPLTLTCTASPAGHPAPSYRWWRRERPDAPLGSSQNFTVGSVLPRHAGHYVCQPENELGSGAPASAEVRVLRAPQLTGPLLAQVKRPAATAAFSAECAAQGRPRPAVTWLKDGEELQTADGRYDVTIDETEREDGAFTVRSALNYRGWARKADRLEPADRGNYTCRFENAAGTAETTMLLRIRHAPIVYHQYNKVAFDVGESAVIACQMQAYPAPVFRWSRGAAATAAASPLTNTSTSRLGNDVHQSELRLPLVSAADYGEYVCQAQNAEGEHSTVLRLQAKGRPEPPTEVHATELGTSWALLDWTPGFDGGFSRTIQHVTLRDERDKERAFDCQMRRPCNVTSLQHRTTYRLRVNANNTKGDSAMSEQVQFTTLLDESQLPAPQRARFAPDAGQLSFHVLSSELDVVGTLDVRSDGGEWRRSEQQVSVTNNRGRAQLDAALVADPVTDVRVRLCLREEPSVCGQPLLAEHVSAGSALVVAGGSQVTTIILVSVGAIAAVAVLVLLFICCCRRSNAARSKTSGYTDATYSRQKVPAYYPPTDGVQNKSVTDAPDLSQLALEPAKVLFAGGPPRAAAYEPSYSNSNSNAGGSVNSQDSLWQAREGGRSYPPPLQHESAGYDPAAAGYDLGYGDYGAYPPQEATYRYDEYNREAEQYGAAPAGHVRQQQTADASYGGVSGMPDPYAGRPEPESKPPQLSFDESLESGYSTPNTRTRRVIREIIV